MIHKYKFFLLGIALWLLGALLALPLPITQQPPSIISNKLYLTITENKQTVQIPHRKKNVFLTILLNNFFVAILISVGGLLSAGILTCIVFVWNGFLLMTTIKTVNVVYKEGLVDLFLYHGIFEIVAFLLFGVIGFKGFIFWKTILKDDKISWEHLPKWRSFLLPSILLTTAAGIEYYLIITHVK